MPITADAALALTDPALPDADRERAASNIMAGVAANDAYLDSRPQLEQIIARAQGGLVPPAHADLAAGTMDPIAGSIPGTATEVPAATPTATAPVTGMLPQPVTPATPPQAGPQTGAFASGPQPGALVGVDTGIGGPSPVASGTVTSSSPRLAGNAADVHVDVPAGESFEAKEWEIASLRARLAELGA